MAINISGKFQPNGPWNGILDALDVDVDATGFSGNLSGTDTDAQTALETLDALSVGGDVTKVGTPANNQVAVWTGDGTLEGDTDLQFSTTTNALAIGPVSGSGSLSVFGTNQGQNFVSLGVTTTAGYIKLQQAPDTAGSNYVSIYSPAAVTTSYNITLPAVQATSADQILVNDGSGNLSWEDQTGGGGGTGNDVLSNQNTGTGCTLNYAVYESAAGVWTNSDNQAGSETSVSGRVGICTAVDGSNGEVTLKGDITVASHGVTGPGVYVGTGGTLIDQPDTNGEFEKLLGWVVDANTIAVDVEEEYGEIGDAVWTDDHASITGSLDLSVAGHTFTQTGGVVRNLEGKTKERVDFLDFVDNTSVTHASILDGSNTVSLSTQLFTAINSGASILDLPQGGEILFDDMTTTLSNVVGLTINGNGCRLKIKDSTTIETAAQDVTNLGFPAFFYFDTSCSNITVRDIILDGNATGLHTRFNKPAGVYAHFAFDRCDDIVFEDCTFTALDDYGFMFLGCKRSGLRRCVTYDCNTRDTLEDTDNYSVTTSGSATTDHLVVNAPGLSWWHRTTYEVEIKTLTGGPPFTGGTFKVTRTASTTGDPVPTILYDDQAIETYVGVGNEFDASDTVASDYSGQPQFYFSTSMLANATVGDVYTYDWVDLRVHKTTYFDSSLAAGTRGEGCFVDDCKFDNAGRSNTLCFSQDDFSYCRNEDYDNQNGTNIRDADGCKVVGNTIDGGEETGFELSGRNYSICNNIIKNCSFGAIDLCKRKNVVSETVTTRDNWVCDSNLIENCPNISTFNSQTPDANFPYAPIEIYDTYADTSYPITAVDNITITNNTCKYTSGPLTMRYAVGARTNASVTYTNIHVANNTNSGGAAELGVYTPDMQAICKTHMAAPVDIDNTVNVDKTFDDAGVLISSNAVYDVAVENTVGGAGVDVDGQSYALSFTATKQDNYTRSASPGMVGIQGIPIYTGTGLITDNVCSQFYRITSGVANSFGKDVGLRLRETVNAGGGSSTVTDKIGLEIQQDSTSTITNQYGVTCEQITVGSSNKKFLYLHSGAITSPTEIFSVDGNDGSLSIGNGAFTISAGGTVGGSGLSIPGANITGTVANATNATTATTATNATALTTTTLSGDGYITMSSATSGFNNAKTDSGLIYNSVSDTLFLVGAVGTGGSVDFGTNTLTDANVGVLKGGSSSDASSLHKHAAQFGSISEADAITYNGLSADTYQTVTLADQGPLIGGVTNGTSNRLSIANGGVYEVMYWLDWIANTSGTTPELHTYGVSVNGTVDTDSLYTISLGTWTNINYTRIGFAVSVADSSYFELQFKRAGAGESRVLGARLVAKRIG